MDPVRFFTAGFRAPARLRQFPPAPTDFGDNARNRDWHTLTRLRDCALHQWRHRLALLLLAAFARDRRVILAVLVILIIAHAVPLLFA